MEVKKCNFVVQGFMKQSAKFLGAVSLNKGLNIKCIFQIKAIGKATTEAL